VSGAEGSRPVTPEDRRFMDAALAYAYAALGSTAPNPAVGCVIVKDGRVLAAAATAAGGRPHAETQALALAGGAARGATVYVTLEPCAHHGQTPPCAEALVEAGVGAVVIACRDPFAQVDGRGAAILKSAGIRVIENIRREAAEALNAGFFETVRTGRALAVEDDRPGLADACFEMRAGETAEEALARAGGAGLTRVRLVRSSETQR
jgi:diaminohydroxyphosphoribosylaminopyrimidine deaminase / 5-amino-6-(5-phosphoribosylamino)uracil reductase